MSVGPSARPMSFERAFRMTLVAIGLIGLTGLLTVLALEIAGSGQVLLGPRRLIISGAMAMAIALGIVDWSSRVGSTLVSLAVVVASTFAGLLMFEVWLWSTADSVTQRASHYRTFVPAVADERTEYRLAANTVVEFDDGIASGTVTTNSLGYRGRDPSSLGQLSARILLIGDSFAFGNLLDNSQTMDSQIEALSGSTMQAFNLGVGGYGALHVLETLRVNSWFTGGDIVYLFYLNDLRDDAMTMDNNLVYKGHLVIRRDAHGRTYSPEDYEAQLARLITHPTAIESIRSTVGQWSSLGRIRDLVWRSLNPDKALLGQLPGMYRATNVNRVVGATLEMRRIADARDSTFHVVIIPSMEEAAAQAYSTYTQMYVDQLRAENVQVLEILDELTPGDYWAHDGHFNPAGSSIVAARLVENVRD